MSNSSTTRSGAIANLVFSTIALLGSFVSLYFVLLFFFPEEGSNGFGTAIGFIVFVPWALLVAGVSLVIAFVTLVVSLVSSSKVKSGPIKNLSITSFIVSLFVIIICFSIAGVIAWNQLKNGDDSGTTALKILFKI